MQPCPAGSITVAIIGGVPVYVHWSVPIGSVFPAAFAGYDPLAFFYFVIGYILLIGVHEFGHVAAVRITGNLVLSVEISGIGGLCRFQFKSGDLRHALLIAAGGLVAQAILFTMALSCQAVFEGLNSPFANCVFIMFTFFNALLFLMNVLPSRTTASGLGTDGNVIWQLIKMRWQSRA